jgi:glycosyltransferase involved in cell wall biosynthesis
MGKSSEPAARVSVVMGVRNGADTLATTIESLTSQQGVDLEVIVVNDGSTDATGEILDALAADDDRLRVFHREGRGLTESLIEGCQMAKGEFIARQDAGDWSLPGRLQRQAACLRAHPEASLCSTHARWLVPEGATVQINTPDAGRLSDGLTGPATHGSVMMRRNAYLEAGGYRSAFYYAQDIDLWSRLVEVGTHPVVPEVLYEATLSPGSISGSRSQEQAMFHSLIVGATKARRSGNSEKPWLERATALSRECRQARRSAGGEAAGAYFIGACLAAGQQPDLARRYLEQALKLNPWHLKARLKLTRL